MKIARLPLLIAFVVAGIADTTAGSLADSPSPFVRAQASSGVKWHAWDDQTLAAAAKQEKPVYVFVASELSGLSRATIAQTFASEKTVAWINEEFFPIFVDEDAQPDVAAYAQHFINSAKQMRGSPVHFWLTPDMRPYDGANYLPPSEEWGRPGFLKAARAALDSFNAGPQHLNALVGEAMSMMRLIPIRSDASNDATARLASATEAWIAAADKVHGGFGSAPKNPEPELIRFLLGRGDEAREVAIAAARAIVNGALRDPVDGGFYRRCIDEAWKEPFHQKLLSDQARIALALFEAADAAKDNKLRAAAIGALDFALKELRNPDGTFAAALDGTTEESSDLKKRPKFAKVGSANSGAVGLLVAALVRSGEKRFVEATKEIPFPEVELLGMHRPMLAHSSTSSVLGTPADFFGTVLAMRRMFEDEEAEDGAKEVVEMANKFYFDAIVGRYMATHLKSPPGIAVRAPGSPDPLPAEVLALLAGVDAATAKLLRLGLLDAIEYDELPPGHVLLALSKPQK
jgi:uncharacterized protein